MIRFWDDFERIIKEYEIEPRDICLVGSGVLTEEGFRENHDFDFAVTNEARQKLLKVHGDSLNILPTGTVCFTDDIQILQDRYGEVGIDDKLLFTDAFSKTYKNGCRIAIRELEIAKKIVRLVEKDVIDLREIGKSDKVDFINWNLVLELICNKKENLEKNANCRYINLGARIISLGKHICEKFYYNKKEKDTFVELEQDGFFCAILWGTVEQYYKEIELEIAKSFSIVKSITYDNVKNIEQLVNDIYSIDNVDMWKIKLKQAYLADMPSSIKILIYKIDNPKFRVSKRTGKLLSDAGAELKNKIRTEYKTKLDRYIYDVIIHTGDNYDISKRMLEVLRNYVVLDVI